MQRADPRIYCFDSFRLDPQSGVLLSPDGIELHLRPKTYAVLHHLLDNPGRLLGRQELLDVAWPGVVVTDDSLTQCVSDLRHAFGARAAQIIRTVPKRGYVLMAQVRRDEPHRSGDVGHAAMTAYTPGIDIASLREDRVEINTIEASDGERAAVLFAKALTVDLLAITSRIEGMRVRRADADAVRTGYRVVGEARVVGTVPQVALRLEDASTGAVVWAERLEQSSEGQSGLSKAALLTVAAQLNRQVARHSLSIARRKSLETRSARELCLIGRDHHRRMTEVDTRIAWEMFARAIETDPEYSQAYAWQSYTVQRAITHGWGSPSGQHARNEALRLARIAVYLQPESTLCLSRLAFALVLDQRWDEAIDAARAALTSARPAFAFTRITCCEVLTAAGLPEEAARIAQETIALEPNCPPSVQGILGRALLLAGNAEDALPPLRWCRSQLSDYAATYDTLVVALIETGRLPEALAARRDLFRIRPDWTPRNHTAFWYFRRPEDLHRFEAAHLRAAELTDDAAARSALSSHASIEPGPDVTARPVPVKVRAPSRSLASTRQDTLVLHPLEASADQNALRAASALSAGLMDGLVRNIDLSIVSPPDLGAPAEYEMKGTVQLVNERLCAHLRLIDGTAGTTLWSQRLECFSALAEEFSVRSIEALAAAIEVEIARRSMQRARRKPQDELTARELWLLGRRHYYHSTEAETAKARRLFASASAVDPDYAHAYAWQAFAAARVALHGWKGPRFEETVGEAIRLARCAVELQAESPPALAALALALSLQDRWTEAVAMARLALGARYAAGEGTRIVAGDVLAAAGYAEEAEAALRYAVARDAHCSPVLHAVLGRALLAKGLNEEAIGELRLCAVRLPDYALCFRTMAVAAMEAGIVDEARGAVREVARLRPDWIAGTQPIFWFLRRSEDVERYERAYRMAVHLDVTARAGGLLKAPASRA